MSRGRKINCHIPSCRRLSILTKGNWVSQRRVFKRIRSPLLFFRSRHAGVALRPPHLNQRKESLCAFFYSTYNLEHCWLRTNAVYISYCAHRTSQCLGNGHVFFSSSGQMEGGGTVNNIPGYITSCKLCQQRPWHEGRKKEGLCTLYLASPPHSASHYYGPLSKASSTVKFTKKYL